LEILQLSEGFIRMELAIGTYKRIYSYVRCIDTIRMSLKREDTMQKKLTLSVDSDLVEFAREYVRESNQSISGMVEAYFRGLRRQGEAVVLSKKTTRLYGVLLAPK